MGKTAWIFPGQGSQTVGMQADLAEVASDRLARASEILGWSLLELCAGDEERLSQTRYTQPCLYTIEAILVDLLRDRSAAAPDLVAGHSLGEYVALYAAGVFDFETGLRLVKRRAELMAAATGGMMVALMKFDRAELDAALAQTEGVVLANDNSPQQVVVSGSPAAVGTLCDRLQAKRAIPLKVSGAFHSPLMVPAAEEFAKELDIVSFATANVPVLSNVDPSPETAGEILKERLRQQMTGAVRWRELMLRLAAEGVDRTFEIGPGKVLGGLLGRTCAEIETVALGSAAAIAQS